MLGRKKQEPVTKLQARVAKISTSDLTTWAEQALFGIGRSLSSHQRSLEMSDLLEAEQGAEALHAVVSEIVRRNTP